MNQEPGKMKNNPMKSLKGGFKLFFEKYVLKQAFFNNKIILWSLALNLFLNLSNWVLIAVFINRLDGDIILHYNVYFGVDSMGDWRKVLLLPIIGLILFFLNATLSAYFYTQKERIASYILLLASMMVQINLIIAAVSIVMINY